MSGYLGQAGWNIQEKPSGFAFLARDVTTLEGNQTGWGNLPPWGYARNRPVDNAPPVATKTQDVGLSGFIGAGRLRGFSGCCGGLSGLDAAVMAASNAYALAIMSAMSAGPQQPDFSNANSLMAEVTNPNAISAISSHASGAQQGIQNILDYGDDGESRAIVSMHVTALQSLAAGLEPQPVPGDQWTDADPDLAKKDAESIGLLTRFAMSDAGKKVIQTGAFTSGVTGINKQAILEEGKRSDIDVAGLVKAGESFASYGKYLGIAVALGVGYVVAKRMGVL